MYGERIRLHRVLLKLTQTQLGLACGVQQGTISKIEKDKYTPSNELMARLALALGCDLAVLTAPPPPGTPLYTIHVNVVGPTPSAQT